ncbi:MAG: serine hydrolase, partial [Candidatus Omnitrophica bacterium]|nr:serine hydrolase [Candidatus Omnitrophota bacterium]
MIKPNVARTCTRLPLFLFFFTIFPFSTHATINLCDTAACCPGGVTQDIGTAASDKLKAVFDPECLVGLQGPDQLTGGLADDVLLCGPGNDTCKSKNGNDIILGGAGDDIIDGGLHDDQISGGDGNDVIDGGSTGDDQIWGDAGNDVIDANVGDDFVHGGSGADEIDGSTGEDVILGGPGDDIIDGGLNDDWIRPGAGRDVSEGSTGNDTFVILHLCEIEAGETIDGELGHDKVESPLSQIEMENMGMTFTSIEEFVQTPEIKKGACAENEDGELVCECCSAGFSGTDCSQCAEGYHPAAPGGQIGGDVNDELVLNIECVPDETCDSVDCGEHGECAVENGSRTCVCQPGYTGDLCSACVPGLELVNNVCVGTDSCAAEFCYGKGECMVSPDTHQLICTCQGNNNEPNCGLPPLYIDGALLSISEQDQAALLAYSPDGEACNGGYQWTIKQGGGNIIPQGGNNAQAIYTPAPLANGQLINNVVLEAKCLSDAQLITEIVVSVTALNGYPVSGFGRADLTCFDEVMLEYMTQRDLVGGTLAVTYNDQLVLLRGYGYRNEAQTEVMKTCTPSRLASVTKPMTKAAIRSLYGIPLNNTTFESDTDISDEFPDLFGLFVGNLNVLDAEFILPESEYNLTNWPTWCNAWDFGLADFRWPIVTVKHLVDHTSGIITNDGSKQPNVGDPHFDVIDIANLLDLDDPPTERDLLKYTGGACFTSTPNFDGTGTYNYSNIGYRALGEIIEIVSGKGNWLDYLKEEIYQPKGIFPGTDPQTGDVLYQGRSLAPDVNPEEPFYFTGEERGNVVQMFKDGDTWVPAANVPLAFGGFNMELLA